MPDARPVPSVDVYPEFTPPSVQVQTEALGLSAVEVEQLITVPPIMIQPLASASRVAMIGLTSRQASLLTMSVLARWKLRRRLMGVPA